MGDSIDQARYTIAEFENLKKFGLQLNKDKTCIISDMKEMKDVQEIEGVRV